jgi:soluble cytochrome b562
MSLRTASTLVAFALTASSTLAFQAPDKAAMAGRVTELKESIAANRARLAKYQWTETTTISLKGEVKKTETSLCHYGPDGKVVKTPTGPQEAAQQQPKQREGRFKARIVEKKVDELKDYGERLKSLVGEYVPPNRDKIQDAFQAGNVSIAPSSALTSMTISNYYKAGDKLIFAFDPTAKKIRQLNVDSYLDDPKTDIVTLAVNFASLPDGTNYAANTDLVAKSKQIEIKTANSNYQKITP